MKPTEFRVLLADVEDPTVETELTVRVLHGDMLRAELEAPQHGFTDMKATPMHFTTLWIWASLRRTHVIEDGFQAFKPRLLQLDEVEEPDETGDEADGLDPTQPEALTS
jgi:hypothetical protein